MEDSGDDDVIVVPYDNSDHVSNLQTSQQIINIDLSMSDEESCEVSDPLAIGDVNPKSSLVKPNTVFQTWFQNISEEKELDPDIIDLDGDDIDALAPLRSLINPVKGSTRMKILNHVNKRQINFTSQENKKKRFSPPRKICGDADSKLKTNNTNVADVTYHLSSQEKVQNICEMRHENFGMDIPIKKYILFKPDSNKLVSELEPRLVSPNTSYTLVNKPDSLSSDNGNGIIDLNINITNGSSPVPSNALSNNVSSGFKHTIDQWQKTSSQYNVALGLVVNVNQTATCHRDIKEKGFGIGDIAVSLSMSNKSRYPLNLSEAKQATDTVDNKKNVYFCNNCSFKTINCQTFNSHLCKPQANQKFFLNESAATETVPFQHLVCKKNRLVPKTNDKLHKTVMYECLLCSLKTNSIELMKQTRCSKFQTCHPKKLKKVDEKSQVIISDERIMKITNTGHIHSSGSQKCGLLGTSSCTRHSYRSLDSEALKKHNSFVANRDNNDYAGRKYHCIGCSYSSECLDDLNIHICPFKKTLTWNENSHNQLNSQNIDNWDIFSTLFYKLFKSYEYVGETSVSSGDSALRSQKQSPQFSCLACSFITEDLKQVNTHKCQKDSLMHKIDTAVHTVKRKFSFEKVHVCALCNDQVYFSSGEAMSGHYAMVHKEVFTRTDKILNRCTFCNDIMDDKLIKGHLTSHIRQYENIIKSYFFQDDFVDLISRLGETPLDIQNPSELCDKGPIKCYSCKQEICVSGMKCVNPDCENWYHIQCCNIYSRQLLPQEVSDFPDWFCPNCNKKEDRNISTVVDNIEVVDFCLNVTDELLLREMEIQNTMLSEMTKIKDEKQATKEEFARIKNFIMNSKSERINNPMTRAVFSIVERFVDGGTGGSDT